jgi:hypothetical protein
MSVYTFTYQNDIPGSADVLVCFDDRNGEYPYIEHVIEAFEQFLLGVTYQPGSIAKYIDKDKLERQLMAYLEARAQAAE